MYRYLVILTIASTIGLESWMTLSNNFAAEVVALEGIQVGLIQSEREIPGFLAFLVVYLLLIVKEHRLSALAIIVLGLGMTVAGLLPSFSALLAFYFYLFFFSSSVFSRISITAKSAGDITVKFKYKILNF